MKKKKKVTGNVWRLYQERKSFPRNPLANFGIYVSHKDFLCPLMEYG